MKKIVHPCDAPIWNGKKWPVFCKIEFEDGKLSISGVHGPLASGNAMGSCGQIEWGFDHLDKEENDSRGEPILAKDLRFAPGWNQAKWYKFLHYWKEWHLNDMQAACEHQREMGWTYENHHGVWVPDKKIVIDEFNTGEQPMKFDPYKGEACPVCGYEIGSAWLTKEVPQDVIDFLFSLPDTDRRPNWV